MQPSIFVSRFQITFDVVITAIFAQLLFFLVAFNHLFFDCVHNLFSRLMSVLHFSSSCLTRGSKMKFKKLEWKLPRKNFLSATCLFFITELQLSISVNSLEKGNDISGQINHCDGKMTANVWCSYVRILESSSFAYLMNNNIYNKSSCTRLIGWAKIPSFHVAVTWLNFSWCISWPNQVTEFSNYLYLHFFWVF